MYAHARVLLFGHNGTLLDTRGLILEKAGFQVSVAKDLARAAEMIAIHPMDAFVLCQTLSDQERCDAITMADALRQQMRILVMTDEYSRFPEDRTAAVLETIVHPMDLIAAVRTLVRSEVPEQAAL